MSNCAIITLHNCINYGAMLQAYALQTALSRLGHKVVIINYGHHPDPPRIFSGKRGLVAIPHAIFYLLQRGKRLRKYRRFIDFQDRFMQLTRHYPDLASLEADSPTQDVLVCGSDQIWNPDLEFHHEYFLNFGDDSARRVAYAPSFGVAEMPSESNELFARLSARIDSLSCRESSGVKIIEEVTGRNATHVCDPTLLIDPDHWLSISAKPEGLPPRYILVYALVNSAPINEAVARIAKALSLPVVCIQIGVRNPSYPAATIFRDAGPLEFLGLIANSDFVITNSYHGTLFSVLFRKRFYCPKFGSRNERMRDLLSVIGMIDCQDLEHTMSTLPSQIDYDSVTSRLSEHIGSSMGFLKNAIEGRMPGDR